MSIDFALILLLFTWITSVSSYYSCISCRTSNIYDINNDSRRSSKNTPLTLNYHAAHIDLKTVAIVLMIVIQFATLTIISRLPPYVNSFCKNFARYHKKVIKRSQYIPSAKLRKGQAFNGYPQWYSFTFLLALSPRMIPWFFHVSPGSEYATFSETPAKQFCSMVHCAYIIFLYILTFFKFRYWQNCNDEV